MQVDRRTWQQGPGRADHVHGAAAEDQIVLANGIAGHNLDEPADALERPLGDHHAADDRPGVRTRHGHEHNAAPDRLTGEDVECGS
jgi:hypothetical protein